MGFLDRLKTLFKKTPTKHYTVRWTIDDLARRLDIRPQYLRLIQPAYQVFAIAKANGGKRIIAAPDKKTKEVQRLVLGRLLKRLKCHACATGFEKGHSIVTNAQVHCGADVILRMDIQDFFSSTSAERILDYFRSIGWDEEAAHILLTICSWEGGLPQGAPTSPRLSNLVNVAMDARLAGFADRLGCVYTRYADDITFSIFRNRMDASHFSVAQNPKTLEKIKVSPDHPRWEKLFVSSFIYMTNMVLGQYGYRIHRRRKFHIRRRHQRQLVTGLVVNEKPTLPRETRRWLRAVEHRLATGRDTSLTEVQLEGWKALRYMIESQSEY